MERYKMKLNEKVTMIVEDLQGRVRGKVTKRFEPFTCDYVFTIANMEFRHYYSKAFHISEIDNNKTYVIVDIIMKEYEYSVRHSFII